MTLKEMLERAKADRASKLAERNAHAESLAELRTKDEVDEVAVSDIRAKKNSADEEIDRMSARIDELERELADDERMQRLSEQVGSTTAKPSYDRVARVGQEARTYRPDTDKRGVGFATDVVNAFRGDFAASERLSRHMAEERAERGSDMLDRAIGTAALTGLVVPQYLVNEFAGYPRADRPLADAMRKHDLPAQGMTAYLGKITTGTTVAEQTSQNSAVSETDADDTLVTVPILTAAGSQTVSRQASDRGVGVEDSIIADLYSAYRANLDSMILNRGTTGLTAVATSIAFTDTSPTAAELYPKLLAGPAAVEAAMKNAHPGDTVAIMHSRRWYWLQSQLTSTWPLFGQTGIAPQLGGEALVARYGAGFRGILPSGVAVVVDNNIATNFGAATNEDEIYFVSQAESHLWEDPNAPMLIRAEQTTSKSLGIDLVAYGYFAYTFDRVSHAQKIAGTGLVVPVFA